jgi:L-aminopeptidase/D-esterase-like protein
MTTADNKAGPPELTGAVADADAAVGVPGIRVGHAHSEDGHTGCTVVLCEEGAIAGVDIGGSAPGTRETEMLNPTNMVMGIHAVLLTGGSTFGLAAASGVQAYLVDRGFGFRASTGVVVPIVPTACIFDLDVGRPRIYPDHEMGFRACENAREGPTTQGAVGAGIGATVGKALGTDQAMRGGIGTASTTLPGGVAIGAVSVCNAWGDVINLRNEIVAGARAPDTGAFLHTEEWLLQQTSVETRYFGMDTTLCVVSTNARFSREQMTKIAMMAQDGIARATRPSHTLFDGDVVFALSVGSGGPQSDVNVVGAAAARLVSQAIIHGVRAANPAPRPWPG